MNVKETLVLCLFCILGVSGQCTFRSPWASSTWLDNTRGTITFSTTTLTGWSTTVFNQLLNTWDCFDNSSSTQLVMRSTSTVMHSTNSFYGYLCMQLTQITTNSYSYVQQFVMQPNAANERLYFALTSQTPTLSSICDASVSVPTLEFHVLVQSGMADSAAISFPNQLLFSADYQYLTSDGGVACDGTADTMDMCTDTTALSFNSYPNCNQQIAYSAGGELWCVATASMGSYDCAVVFNRDATITGTASQFACLCSDGSSVSVVPGNCTADQSPTSYPTAPDGTTVIGHKLLIETVYDKVVTDLELPDCASFTDYLSPVTAIINFPYFMNDTSETLNCVPTPTTTVPTAGSSSSSSAGPIAGAVVVVILLIVVIVVCIILYKRGHCVTICERTNGCLEKTPCWATCSGKICVCCKNKVAESDKPMLINGAVPHAETINETSRPKLIRDKTALSAITRSSSVAGKREKSELDKSLIRQGTVTSITGINIKSARSSVQQMDVKDEEEPKPKLLGLNLSFLVCCPEKKDKTKVVTVEEAEQKPTTADKKKPAKGADKKGVDKKGADKKSADKKDAGKKGAKGKAAKGGKTEKKSQDQQTDKPAKNGTATPTPEEAEQKPTTADKKKPAKGADKKVENGVENRELSRAPTKMKSDLRLTSTPVPGGEKGQKGIVSVPAGLEKPKDKPTEWTFLSCCFGNRSPPPEDKTEATEPEPVGKKKSAAKPTAKGKSKWGGGKKVEGGAKKAAGKKGGGKGGTKKKDVNENDLIEEDLTEQPSAPERAKTMPEREKTALSLQDAQGIKVDVYVPDDKTNLVLKDTVKSKKVDPKLEKAKTDIGATRPPSSRPVSSTKSKETKGKKADKKADKGKDGAKKGSKDKKGGKKKKK